MECTEYNSRTWAEIDLSALKHNFELACKLTNRPVMCVIKANAYGHGAVECGRFLEKNGAAAFAVACLDEAIELRTNGITKPILILGYTQAKYASLLAKYDITQTLVDLEHAQAMDTEASKAGVSVKAHIKLDTGMSRAGLLAQGAENIKNAIESACAICEMKNLQVWGMYTHLSVADTPSQIEYTNWQIDNYIAIREGLEARGHVLPCCHVSNSAAIMSHPRAHFDMVREGIMLYGLYPDSVPTKGDLVPVMTLKSRVSQVRALPASTTISYGRTFKSERDMTSAVVLAGYADGCSRRLSNSVYVMINGKRFNQVGRICMDMFMIDATDSDVKRDDEVTLWGAGGGMTCEEVSQIVGTINYELTCLVTARAKRHYIGG